MTERDLDLDAIRKSLIHDEAVSNLIWPDFFKEQEIIDNGHYVENFEEDYAQNFEDEREIEIFGQNEEKNTISDQGIRNSASLLWNETGLYNPMPKLSDHIFYMKIKPVYGEGEHK